MSTFHWPDNGGLISTLVGLPGATVELQAPEGLVHVVPPTFTP